MTRISRSISYLSFFLLLAVCGSCARVSTNSKPPLVEKEKTLSKDNLIPARLHDAQMPEAFENYKNLLCASDGKIYFILATYQPDLAAQMFQYDPVRGAVRRLADMDEAVGQKGSNAFPQGKCHVDFFEHEGKLYTGLTFGFNETTTETAKTPGIENYRPYPGGLFLSYDLASERFENLARMPEGEGVITMAMDKARGRLYGLTSPGGFFVYYDLAARNFKNLGKEFSSGCRTLAVDPRNGGVYWTTSDGDIVAYRFERDQIEKIEGCDLRDRVFGEQSRTWRSLFWYPKENTFIGITGACMLFRFNPDTRQVRAIEPIPVRAAREGGNEKYSGRCFSPGLGFRLGPDGETIYYIATGAALDLDAGRRLDRTVHFVTYHLPTGKYVDHGKLRLDDGRYPLYAQSIDFADGKIYAVAWIDIPEDSPRAKAAREARQRRPGDSGGALFEINLAGFDDPMFLSGKGNR